MSEKIVHPFITVVSPVRNEEEHIHGCLSALVNQDYPRDRYEILVIDGMSEDKTRDIIKSFVKQHSHVRMYDNVNKTVPFALNIGLQYARGEIIVRVDGHAVVAKDYLAQCSRYLKTTRADCVGGRIVSINETKLGRAIALAMSCVFGVGDAKFRVFGGEGWVDTLAFGAYRREVFDKVGTFDEELVRNQDDEFNYRLRKFGGRIFMTPDIKSYYYPRMDIRKLWRQYFLYGFWKVRVMQKHLKMMQIRQFIPGLFLVSLIGSGILGYYSKPFFMVFASILLSYLVVTLVYSLKVAVKNGLGYFIILPSVFTCLHFSYGFGFICGLIKFIRHWNQPERTS